MIRRTALLIGTVLLAACSSTSLEALQSASDQLGARTGRLPVVAILPADAKVIGTVKAERCQKTKADPAYTKDDIFKELEEQAKLQGANALYGAEVTVLDKGPRPCFWSATGTATAIIRPGR